MDLRWSSRRTGISTLLLTPFVVAAVWFLAGFEVAAAGAWGVWAVTLTAAAAVVSALLVIVSMAAADGAPERER